MSRFKSSPADVFGDQTRGSALSMKAWSDRASAESRSPVRRAASNSARSLETSGPTPAAGGRRSSSRARRVSIVSGIQALSAPARWIAGVVG
jgi:hypothetical protein